MKLYFEGGHITIDDDDKRALKIKQGYPWSINDKGKLVIGTSKVNYDLDNLYKKLKTNSATTKDINEYLLAQLENKITCLK